MELVLSATASAPAELRVYSPCKIETNSKETLCVCCLSDGRLISGHEATLKLWSPMSESKPLLMHSVNLSVRTSGNITESDITCVCQSPRNQQYIAVSVSSSVLSYDLRNLSAPIQVYSYNRDEINQISFHATGPYICACDDSGEVKVINTDNSTLFKTLAGRHSNLCTCAKFLPRKPWEIVSGGMDCKVVRWDFSRPRPITEVSTQIASSEMQLDNMFINPPMVHSLDSWTSNHCFACGLGNGMVAVYEVRDKEIVLKCMSTPHSAMVVCVCCIERVGKRYYVVAGGNDCKIVLLEMTEKEVQIPHQKYACHLRMVADIQHNSKVNWISVDEAGNVIVADQTSFISVYKMF